MAIQMIDDLSANEKNLQMLELPTVEDLINQPDKVREFDTEKVERIERAFSKLKYNSNIII